MMQRLIKERVERAIKEKVFPGCVVGVVSCGGDKETAAYGRLTYDPHSPIVRKSTLYDLASITKVIPTASLALQMIEMGALGLNDLAKRHVPEFNNNQSDRVTIKHLLTYTVGGYSMATLKDKSPEELYDTLMRRDFSFEPGQKFAYSNIACFLLAIIIERVMEKPIADLADERFFIPLGLKHTTFRPHTLPKENIAPTEIESWRGHIQGTVHDESAYVFTVKGNRPVGHAGIFSNAPDLLKFVHMLLKGGETTTKRFFTESTVQLMETNQLASIGESAAYGWELNQPRFMGKYCTPNRFGKTGFTGTSIVIDRSLGKALVILSNRTYPTRPADSVAIHHFRADIADIVFG